MAVFWNGGYPQMIYFIFGIYLKKKNIHFGTPPWLWKPHIPIAFPCRPAELDDLKTPSSWISWISHATNVGELPSGKHTKSYWKWPFIVSFPIEMLVYQRVFHLIISYPMKSPAFHQHFLRWVSDVPICSHMFPYVPICSHHLRKMPYGTPSIGTIWYHLVMTNIANWKIHLFLIGKPSIFMGHFPSMASMANC